MSKLYSDIIKYCDPNIPKNESDVFDILFKTNNFIGGSNSKQRTKHEKIFSLMNKDLKEQVTFGTGKGGYEKYLSKKYTVDFYDEKNKIAYEIDGKSHSQELCKLKDKIKECFLYENFGIKTVRITNQQVEKMLYDRVQKIEKVII